MTIDVRQLTLDELPLIGDLDTSASEQVYDLAEPDAGSGLVLKKRTHQPPGKGARWGANEIASRMELWRRNYGEGCTFWGALSDGRLVGFLLLSGEEVNGALEIFSLCVDREFRGRGAGTQLVSAAEKHCASSGVKSLYVTTTLNGTAIDFYLKSGFRLAGLHARCYRRPQGRAAFIKEVEAEP